MKRVVVFLIGVLSLLFVSCNINSITVEDPIKLSIDSSNVTASNYHIFVINGHYIKSDLSDNFQPGNYTLVVNDVTAGNTYDYSLNKKNYETTIAVFSYNYETGKYSYLSSKTLDFNSDTKVFILNSSDILVI